MNSPFHDATVPGDRSSSGSRWIPFLVFLFTAAITLFAFLRIHTYVTGQDPRTFIVLGRRIAEAHFSLSALRDVAQSVIPGYPFLLASIISLWGIHAAFWTNTVLFVATVVILNRLFARLLRNEWQAGVLTLFCLAGLFAGYRRNAHFLLLAFRQTPAYLCMVAGELCLLRAAEGSGRRFFLPAFAAGCLVLLGAGVRETGIFMALPLALFALARRPTPGGPGRFALSLSFLLPILAAGVAGIAVLLFQADVLLNSQSRQFLGMLPALFDFAGNASSFRQTVGFLGDELNGWGLALLAAGLWCARKRPAFLFFFFLPAVLYFLFDGAIKAHRRFFLTTLFLLLPLVALPVAVGLERVRQCLRGPRWNAPLVVYLPAFLLLAAWGVSAVRPLSVWGVKVTAAEIVLMKDRLARPAAGEASLLIDGRTRYLADALTVFTHYAPLNAADPGVTLVRTPPRLFIEPLNKEALHPLDHAVSGADAISARGRLERTGIRFALGTGEYEIGRVLPWAQTRIEIPLPSPPSTPALLSLIAPRLWDVPPPRTFVHTSVDGRTVLDRLEPGANYALVDLPDPEGRHTLVIESDAPIPADFQPGWRRLDQPIDMNFGELAFPSFDHYLSGEFFVFPSSKRDSRELESSGVIRLPVLYPSNTYLIVMAGVSTVHDDKTVTVTLAFSSGGRTLAAGAMPAAPRLQPVTLHIGPIGNRPLDRLRLDLKRDRPYQREPPDRSGWNYRLHNLILYPILLGTPLRLDIGAQGDVPYAGEGFHNREGSPDGDGRWTSERARVFLPLQPGRDHQLELSLQTNRPAKAPGADLRLRFNGEPLSFRVAGGRLAADVPAGRILCASNSLEILAVPWRPCDLRVSPDTRSLGVFLQSVAATPVAAPKL